MKSAVKGLGWGCTDVRTTGVRLVDLILLVPRRLNRPSHRARKRRPGLFLRVKTCNHVEVVSGVVQDREQLDKALRYIEGACLARHAAGDADQSLNESSQACEVPVQLLDRCMSCSW